MPNQVRPPPAPAQALDATSVALQRAIGNQGVQRAARLEQSNGAPVPAAVRTRMEVQLGHDFSDVRIHDGADANRSARELDAVAFTTGNDIVLGPEAPPLTSAAGGALLAHELGHVVQQRNAIQLVDAVSRPGDASERAADAAVHGGRSVAVSGPVPTVQRQGTPTDEKTPTGHQEGSGQVIKPVTIGGRAYTYLIWGVWQQGDSLDKFRSRLLSKWVPWRFKGITAAQQGAVIAYLQSSSFVRFDTVTLTPGRNYSLPLEDGVLRQARALSGEAAREQALKDQAAGDARDAAEHSPGGVTSSGQEREAKPKTGEQGDPSGERSVPLEGKPDVMAGNPALARLYVNVLQRYAGVKVDVKSDGGLTADQVKAIVAGNSRAQTVSDVFTRGWVEYRAAGEDDVATFGFMAEALLTQRDRGNFTALHNQLEFDKDREGLGLYKRGTIFRYYDSTGQPIPTNVGGYRDPGYRAVAPSTHAAQVPITDRGLLKVLGGIKNVAYDDAALIYQSAKGYYDNGDLLFPAVRDGWDGWKAIAAELKEQLGGVIFFLGLEGIATVLKKLQDPKAQGAGLILEEFLKRAGKFFSFVFGAELAALLYFCGLELSKVQRDPGTTALDPLSQQHLDRAAVQMRQLLTMMIAAGLTAATVAAARKGAVKLGPPSGGGLAPATATGPALGTPQAGAGAVPAAPGYHPPLGIPKPPSKLETGGGGSGKQEETAKPGEQAPPAKSPREQAKDRLSALLEERGRTQAKIEQLEHELFAARSKVNQLRKRALAADRGSKEYSDATRELRDAEAALKEIQEVDELGGYREERSKQNRTEEAILESLALKRPNLWTSTTETIRRNAKRNAAGQFLDANTGEVIIGEPVYGHKYGREHRRLVLEATKRGMGQEQFNTWVNEHPEWFQLETKANNESHRFEKKGVD